MQFPRSSPLSFQISQNSNQIFHEPNSEPDMSAFSSLKKTAEEFLRQQNSDRAKIEALVGMEKL